jgi:hypothetical protein
MLGGYPINWMNNLQAIVVFLITKAKYRTLLEGDEEIIWLKRLFIELQIGDDAPTKLYIDNQSSMKLIKNLVLHAKNKHIEISHHCIREKVQDGTIEINYIPMHEQIVNLLMKFISRIHLKFV